MIIGAGLQSRDIFYLVEFVRFLNIDILTKSRRYGNNAKATGRTYLSAFAMAFALALKKSLASLVGLRRRFRESVGSNTCSTSP